MRLDRRKLRDDEMDLNLHYFPRPLAMRAKSRAASVGLTLKQWIIGLIQRALRDTAAVDASGTVIPDGRTTRDLTLPPAEGRRDLPPREDS